jgi:hypothetical protein
VGSNAKVVVKSHCSPPFGLPAFTMSVLRGSFCGPLGASFGDSPIEHHVDIRVVLEALEEMPVEPLVLAGDHELVSHAEAILRRWPVMHVQKSSRARIALYPDRLERWAFIPQVTAGVEKKNSLTSDVSRRGHVGDPYSRQSAIPSGSDGPLGGLSVPDRAASRGANLTSM